jgi:hypothetical protein
MTTREQDVKIEAWVEALRSGKYAQTRGELCRIRDDGSPSYCCLGVAGSLLGIADEAMQRGLDVEIGTIGPNETYEKVKDAYGLTSTLGRYARSALYTHNDTHQWTFEEIADLIESRPEGLFVD